MTILHGEQYLFQFSERYKITVHVEPFATTATRRHAILSCLKFFQDCTVLLLNNLVI